MKKITLLLLLITSFSYGQVVLTEDFEAGLAIPAGWTNNDLITPSNGEVWTFETGGEAALLAAGNTNVYTSGGCEGNYASFNSDAYGDNMTAEDSALESPVFNAGTLTQVTINFNSYFAGDFGGSGFVEVFNGTSWVTVQTLSATGYAGGVISIDVSAELAGVTNAQIRFRWTGNWSVAWYVDNVSVFQCTFVAPAAAAVNMPTDGQTGVIIDYATDTNTLGPFEWTDGAGDPSDSFNLFLGITPSGDDIGSLSGFASGGNINFGWQPNTQYYWFIESVNCAGITTGPIWSFTTQACTEMAPNVVITPGPTDGEMATPIAGPDGAITFNWANGAGDPGSSFTLNLDTVNPPVANSFTNFTNGDPITGLAVNTTYFWSIDAVNCAGTTAGTVWSFTTDTTLSIEDNEIVQPFKVYPNPTSGVLNIKTSLEIDNIAVFNLLGQRVANFNKNSISNDSINLSELSQGLYIITISAGDKTQTFKITKE